MKDCGFDGFFPKNIGPNELVNIICDYIDTYANNVIDKKFHFMTNLGVMKSLMLELNQLETNKLLNGETNPEH